MQTSHPECEACQIKGNSSSGALESNYPQLETEISKETENTPNERLEDVQCSTRIEPSEKSITPMETSKIQGSEKQHQQTNERENSVSDIEDVCILLFAPSFYILKELFICQTMSLLCLSFAFMIKLYFIFVSCILCPSVTFSIINF